VVRAESRLHIAYAAVPGYQEYLSGITLPAFITPNVLSLLVSEYNLKPIPTPAADLAAILK
jgi:hydroxylamine reductase